MNHLPATLLAAAAAAAAASAGGGSPGGSDSGSVTAGGSSSGGGGVGVGDEGVVNGEVLRRVIGDLKELETEAASSAVRVRCCQCFGCFFVGGWRLGFCGV